MNERQFQFEWNEIKAAANLRKHGVSFELASTVFNDPRLLTVADLEHGETEERWFSIGWASSGAILSIVTSGASLIPQRPRFASSQRVRRLRLKSVTTTKTYE